MSLITNFFKKTTQNKPQKPQKPQRQGRPFSLNKPNLDELYSCSVQKTVKDFDIRTINLKNGAIINVAMDSACDFKSIENVYRANMAGQEIIFTYYAKQGFIGFNNCALIAQDWLVNKALALPCDDAIAINYDVNIYDDEVLDEDQNTIGALRKLSNSNKFKIKEICQRFAQNKRKFGQALCIPLIEGVDYSIPFNIDAISPKSYNGLSVIEPQWVSPVLDIKASTDPTSERFYKPTWFKLPNGDLIHYTWFIFNTYGEPSDILKPSYYFGGYPLPQMLYEYVYAAHKTAKEAPMLAQSKRLNYIEGNVNAYLGDEERLHREINLMSWLRNNWGWLLVKKDQRIGQLDTNLTDFDAVTMLGYQIVAAISGVQSARLLETSPKGWQSSGSLEDKNYAKTLQAIQRLDYTPILEFHYQLLAKSEFGVNKEYTVTFDPIDTPTEKELAEIREINARTDTTYVNAGVVSAEEVRGILREDERSGYNALAEEMEGEGLPEEGDPFEDTEGGSEFSQDPFSMDEESKKWITTKNNVHVPLDKDESKKEACEKFFSKKENALSKDITELLGEEIKGVTGQEAINTLFEKKSGHVKNAFYREDTGPIDLIWGDDNKGLCHIIKQRQKQNIDIKTFLSNLSEVIEKGDMRISPDRGNFELLYNGKMAIIAPTLENNKITFLLTAFKTSKKRHKK